MDDQQRADLAAQVREARGQRGWSQARLASEAGVSENTVLKLEQGVRATQPAKVRQILDALGVAPAMSVIELDGVPEDVQIFLTVAAQRLRVMDPADRNRVLADLYPRLLLGP
jgi:transcriptional regulator with XRE-family HTH domain